MAKKKVSEVVVSEAVEAVAEEAPKMSELDCLKVLARTQGLDQTASDGSIVKQDGTVIAPEQMADQLPDFLRLPEAVRERELARQDHLRQEFHSRAQLSGVAIEHARSMVIEGDLREALKTAPKSDKNEFNNRLADALAAQGRFTEASAQAKDKELKVFYDKAAQGMFENAECSCSPPIEYVGEKAVRLPKYRVIKEVYSLKYGLYGYLVECNKCQNWAFTGSNPISEMSIDEFLKK